MTSSKEEVIINTGAVKFGRKITQETIDDYTDRYLANGWIDTSDDRYLAFDDPVSGWIHMYCRKTSRFYGVDGRYTVNLVETKLGDAVG